jgi:hypothetical protein
MDPLLALLFTQTRCGTETPTKAVVSNGYPASEALAVYRITQRIFPGEFAGVTYDAATCTTTPVSDGGPTPLVDAALPLPEASVTLDGAAP